MAHTISISDDLAEKAGEKLGAIGLTLSDAVSVLLVYVVNEGELPSGLLVDPEVYEKSFHGKVKEALSDTRSTLSHQTVMRDVQALIDKRSPYA